MRRFLYLLICVTIPQYSFATSSYNDEAGVYPAGEDRQLQYFHAWPSSGTSDRIFISVDGDGGDCGPYHPSFYRKIIETVAPQHHIVIYESAKQALCGTDQYAKLDFYHRMTELRNLVATLRQQPKLQNLRYYLVGHSAGVHVVAKAALKIPDVSGLVLISSARQPVKYMSLSQILMFGYFDGLAEKEIKETFNREVSDIRKIFSDCSRNKVFNKRSTLFRCQLMGMSVEGQLKKLDPKIPIYLFHGGSDRAISVEESYLLYSRLVLAKRRAKLKVYPQMGHGYGNEIEDIYGRIFNWSNQR